MKSKLRAVVDWSQAVILLMAFQALGTTQAVGAVAVDTTTMAQGTTSTVAFSHTTSGADRLMLIGVSINKESGGVPTVLATTNYFGSTMTSVGARSTSDGKARIEIWRLVGPATGSHTITVNLSGTPDAVTVGAMTFTGVDATTPLGSFSSATADSASASTMVDSAAGELVFGVLVVESSSDLALMPDTDQLERWDLFEPNANGGGSTEPGSASVNMLWTWTGADKWAVGGASIKPVVGNSISGRVFEDADFAGTASAYDGGAGDQALQGVDVELYAAATDAYIGSTTTDASGNYTFTGLATGSYKVRARSATIGSGTATPKGGLNGTVPGSWPYPLAEMTWGAATAAYGGQSPTADDTTTADNAGPGDTWVSASVSGANVTGVDLGFAYNLIVNASDDANAAAVRSAQGSLRQFIKNANAIGTAGSTTANASEFRMQVATNQSAGGDSWWRITAAAAMPPFADAGTSMDGSTQADNAGSSANGRGPEIEVFGGGVAGSGLEVDSVANTGIRGLTINGFQDHGIYVHGAGAVGTKVYGCYIGTDAVGEGALPNLDIGIWVNDNTSTTDIGSALAGDGNLISGNGDLGTEGEIQVGLVSAGVTIVGNKIGTDRTGTQALGGTGVGISLSGADGVTIGGSAAGAGNIIAGNGSNGIRMSNFVRNVSVLGNKIGVGVTGNETTLGNGSQGLFITSFNDPSNIAIGGTGAGEGNVIAENGGEGVRTQTSGTGDSVQGNTIRDNASGGVRSETDSLLIAKNLIVDNTGDGVYLLNDGGTAANNNKVYQNTIHGNTGDGIRIDGLGALIRNTILTGNGAYGINVTTGSMTESDNLITDAATAPANASGRSNVALDAGDLNLDPRYDNAAGGDYTLNECLSPSVEWGADLAGDQPDMNGVAAGNWNGSAPDQGAFETICTQPAIADLGISKTDAPDPAPRDGPLVYTLIITNNGPGTATNVTVTDVLPVSTTLNQATPSQGTCMGTTTVTCNLGAILNGGTASVEIQVVTSGPGNITNNASVVADQADLVSANDAAAEGTQVVNGGTTDIPLTQFDRIHGFVDFTVTGGTLRTQPNTGDPCLVGNSDSETLSGIPGTATVIAAYLYWAGSGVTVDSTVTFDGVSVTADRTFVGQFVLGANNYDFFSGFEDVTTQVAAKGNGSYSFADLTVDTGNPWCSAKAVVSGWSLLVVYEDTLLTGKTLVLYDGFDIARNGASSYVLTGIWAADPPEAKAAYILWEGDPDLAGGDERLDLNATSLSDGLNPVDNVYNSTINSLGSSTSYGLDLDTFDVSAEVSVGDTLATTEVFTGPDLVILNAVMLQVKSNIIVGSVFEDVNYGGGNGRNRATATAAAPTFAVPRPGAVIELYDAAGNFLRTTTTNANGEYGFAGLIDGDYLVRSVNDTVTSSRPGATGAEVAVQTYRTDASSGTVVPITNEVGGAGPTLGDASANVATANLSTLTAQSVAPVRITTGIAVPGVDFGFNFDTIVNTNDGGQGSLDQFILNSNILTNAGLAQAGLTAGTEHSLFMIPSDADPQGRAQDPGFDAGRGVAVISTGSLLPAIVDPATAVDGTTQTSGVGNSNTATLGAGGTVGTDALALPQLAGPEVEIVAGASLAVGLDLQANGATVRGIAIYGFGSNNNDGNIRAGVDATSPYSGVLIEDNAIGTAADSFTDPDLALPGSGTSGSGIVVQGADGGTLRRNLIGFNGRLGAYVTLGADDWIVEQNEIRRNGLDSDRLDGVSTSSARTTIRQNLIADNQGAGVDFFASPGSHTVDNNTIEDNGWGGVETVGVRMFSSDSTISENIIRNQTGAGVLAVVQDLGFTQTPALRNRVTQNAFSGNGANAIDLQTTLDVVAPGDGITPNDGTLLGDSSVANACGTVATHGNEGLDTPIVDLVLMSGAGATVRGRACPGAEVEIYRAVADGDASDTSGASDYGEGVAYLATVTAAAGTGLFEATGVTGLSAGDFVSAIAIDTSDNTSEFSANAPLQSLSIVKRAFQIDGTPIASGSTLPVGLPIKFLLYIDNFGVQVDDITLQDVLDPVFLYTAGSIKVDDSLDSATLCPAGVCDDAAIFAKVDGTPNVCGMTGSECTDGQDADPVSVSGVTLHAGDGAQAGNAQLDLPAGKVWAMSFTIVMQ